VEGIFFDEVATVVHCIVNTTLRGRFEFVAVHAIIMMINGVWVLYNLMPADEKDTFTYSGTIGVDGKGVLRWTNVIAASPLPRNLGVPWFLIIL
jgi:hypothetical protein